jgi:O-antigen/teichoic acid export membrane protein
MRTTLVFTVPAMAVLAACSDFLMGLMGDQWAPAADVLKILALVSIGKALVFFTGPLLFAVGRPHFRAIMLWALAAVSAGIVLLVGRLLTDEASREQALGMAASRAAYFLAIVIPVNVAVIWWVTGLRPRSFLPWLPGPLLSGAAAIAAVAALELTGVLGRLPDAAALAVAGAAAFSAAGAVLLSLEPEARRLALPVYRKLLRRETDTATA